MDWRPEGPSSSLRNYPELATVRDCLDLGWGRPGGPEFAWGPSMVAKVFPSARLRFEIRASVLAALEGRSADRNGRRSSRTTGGSGPASEGPSRPSPAGSASPPGRLTLIDRAQPPKIGRARPGTRRTSTDFSNWPDLRGIVVYWLLPPLAPERPRPRRLAPGVGRGLRAASSRAVAGEAPQRRGPRRPERPGMTTRSTSTTSTWDRRGASRAQRRPRRGRAARPGLDPSPRAGSTSLPSPADRVADEPRPAVGRPLELPRLDDPRDVLRSERPHSNPRIPADSDACPIGMLGMLALVVGG